jgi:hypothetical protein
MVERQTLFFVVERRRKHTVPELVKGARLVFSTIHIFAKQIEPGPFNCALIRSTL